MLRRIIAAFLLLSVSGIAFQTLASDATINQLRTFDEVRAFMSREAARLQELTGVDVWKSEEEIMRTVGEFEITSNKGISHSILDGTYRLDDYAMTPAGIMGVSGHGIEEFELIVQKLETRYKTYLERKRDMQRFDDVGSRIIGAVNSAKSLGDAILKYADMMPDVTRVIRKPELEYLKISDAIVDPLSKLQGTIEERLKQVRREFSSLQVHLLASLGTVDYLEMHFKSLLKYGKVTDDLRIRELSSNLREIREMANVVVRDVEKEIRVKRGTSVSQSRFGRRSEPITSRTEGGGVQVLEVPPLEYPPGNADVGKGADQMQTSKPPELLPPLVEPHRETDNQIKEIRCRYDEVLAIERCEVIGRPIPAGP